VTLRGSSWRCCLSNLLLSFFVVATYRLWRIWPFVSYLFRIWVERKIELLYIMKEN